MAYKVSKEQMDWLKNNYPLLGAKECALKLKISTCTCQSWANRLGIKLSHRRRSEISRKNAYKQFKKLREKRLELSKNIKIDTPEKAYTLGFLWGDGYLSKANIKTDLYHIRLEILEEDYKDIQKFIVHLGQWKGCARSRNKKPTFCAALCDPVLGIFLKNNDYDKKSLCEPSKILSLIPDNLKYLWWRGYIDADGCFYVRKSIGRQGQRHGTFTIAGNIKQRWGLLKQLLNTLGIGYRFENGIRKSGSYSAIIISNKKGLQSFKNYLFQNQTNIGLKRKRDKILLYN